MSITGFILRVADRDAFEGRLGTSAYGMLHDYPDIYSRTESNLREQTRQFNYPFVHFFANERFHHYLTEVLYSQAERRNLGDLPYEYTANWEPAAIRELMSISLGDIDRAIRPKGDPVYYMEHDPGLGYVGLNAVLVNPHYHQTDPQVRIQLRLPKERTLKPLINILADINTLDKESGTYRNVKISLQGLGLRTELTTLQLLIDNLDIPIDQLQAMVRSHYNLNRGLYRPDSIPTPEFIRQRGIMLNQLAFVSGKGKREHSTAGGDITSFADIVQRLVFTLDDSEFIPLE